MNAFYKTVQNKPAMLALGLTVALLTGTGVTSASGGGAHWAYEGQSGPSHWGNLAQEYSLCKTGINQSPIDIQSPLDSKLFKLEFDYGSVPLQILNNGHTIQINYGTVNTNEEHRVTIAGKQYPLPSAVSHNSTLSVSGEQYKLLQVHFHSPSEHRVSGDPYGMEAHFVHINDAGQLAVVGVLLEEGENNGFIRTLWSHMPGHPNGVNSINGVRVNAAELLPDNREFHHYRGSLTTPPCSEGVRWFVMKDPQQLSRNQIDKFLSVIDHNARPVQPVNSRFVLGSN